MKLLDFDGIETLRLSLIALGMPQEVNASDRALDVYWCWCLSSEI